ncbi:MAG: hypothetical protein ACK4M5_01145, partial [Dietzia cercidiphylli]
MGAEGRRGGAGGVLRPGGAGPVALHRREVLGRRIGRRHLLRRRVRGWDLLCGRIRGRVRHGGRVDLAPAAGAFCAAGAARATLVAVPWPGHRTTS